MYKLSYLEQFTALLDLTLSPSDFFSCVKPQTKHRHIYAILGHSTIVDQNWRKKKIKDRKGKVNRTGKVQRTFSLAHYG